MQPGLPIAPRDGAVGTDDRGPRFSAYLVVLTVVAVTSITLRCLSRSLRSGVSVGGTRLGFWWDDWMALAAMPFILAILAVSFVMLANGFGTHIDTLSPEEILLNLQLFYAGNFLFDAAVTCSKASALFFYGRIFPRAVNSTWFNIALWVVHGLNVAWFIGIVVATFFLCIPMEKSWIPTLEGSCDAQNKVYIGSAVTSVIIDLLILLLPLPNIWQLQLKAAQKSGLLLIFMLGYAVIVVSIGRTVTVLRDQEALNNDITYEGVPLFYWFEAEPVICLLCVCLPAMLTLWRHTSKLYLSPFMSKVSSLWSTRGSDPQSSFRSKSGNFSSGPGGGDVDTLHLRPMPDESPYMSREDINGSYHDPSLDMERGTLPKKKSLHKANISCGGEETWKTEDMPPQGIRVDRTIDVRTQGGR